MIRENARREIEGYGLMTAYISFYYPDAPHIIKPAGFIWQADDIFPHFPVLNRYLRWWSKNIAGRLESVIVTHSKMTSRFPLRVINGEYRLH